MMKNKITLIAVVFALTLMSLVLVAVLADDHYSQSGVSFEYEGIGYEICETDDGYELKVVGGEVREGMLNIPATVSYDGKTCPVVSIEDYCFEKDSEIKTLILPSTIEFVGVNAFSGCINLESVIIGHGQDPSDTYTTIQGKAFSGCVKLSTLDLTGVRGICKEAFHNCKSLSILVLPDCLEYVEPLAFSNLPALREVSVPVNIGLNFSYHDEHPLVEKVILTPGDGNAHDYESIENTLWNTSKAESLIIEIAEGVTRVGNNTFKDCNNVKYVSFPSTLESIGDGAFMNCRALSTLVIPDSVMELGKSSFRNCVNIVDLTLPVSTDSVSDNDHPSFEGCTRIINITLTKGTGYGYDYEGVSKTPWYFANDSMKDLILEGGIIELGNYAFAECKHIVELILPDTLTRISQGAFLGCIGLIDMDLPSSVTVLEDSAFKDCKNLKNMDVRNINEFDDCCLMNCQSLVGVQFSDSLVSIGNYSFYDCNSITELVLPAGLQSVGSYSFSSLGGLHSLTILGSSVIIDLLAFNLTSSVRELIVLADFNTVVNDKTPLFSSFTNVEKVTITSADGKVMDYGTKGSNNYAKTPWALSKVNFKTLVVSDGIRSIGANMFRDCVLLSDITLPDDVDEIRDGAFRGCASISEFTYPVSILGASAFEGCTNLTSVELKHVTSLGEYSFKGCRHLKQILIPDSITSIPRGAFAECLSVVSLTIPDHIESLGRGSFKDCRSLSELVMPVSLNAIVKNDDPAFGGCKWLNVLTLTAGNGYGHDYGDNTYTPWYQNKHTFTTLKVQDGVKRIGDNMFKGCTTLKYIWFCDGLEYIGKNAFKGFDFYDSDGVTKLSIDATVLRGSFFSGTSKALVRQ